MTTIRPGTLDDAAAYVTLRNAIFPYQVNTVDAL